VIILNNNMKLIKTCLMIKINNNKENPHINQGGKES